jgi:hypothetical protein
MNLRMYYKRKETENGKHTKIGVYSFIRELSHPEAFKIFRNFQMKLTISPRDFVDN